MGNENSKTLQEIQISENLEKDHFDIIDDIASIKSLMSDATISARVSNENSIFFLSMKLITNFEISNPYSRH